MKEAIIQYNETPSEGLFIISWKPIVRCKDCKHGKIHGIDVECVAHEEVSYDPEPWHPLDWFCADGVKRDNK